MAVLSAFRQVLHNTQGIIIDSGEQGALGSGVHSQRHEQGRWRLSAVPLHEAACLHVARHAAAGASADAAAAMPCTPAAAPSQVTPSIWSKGLLSGVAPCRRATPCHAVPCHAMPPSAHALPRHAMQVAANTVARIPSEPLSSTLINMVPLTASWAAAASVLAAVFSEGAHDVEENHPLLLRASHNLAERYLALPHVVQRIREASRAAANGPSSCCLGPLPLPLHSPLPGFPSC